MSRNHQTGAPVSPSAAVQRAGTIRIDHAQTDPPSRASCRAFLNVIRSPADLGVHTFIDGSTLLGREPTCTIPLHDFGVSRKHAMISISDNGDFVLKDLQSTNGTRVNGKPVLSPHVLRDGEKIFVGNTVLRFTLADEMEIDFHNEVATLVSTDPLTGLPSKIRFDQTLEFLLQDSKRDGSALALMMMDMDGVKQINDTHGHLFGAYVIGETGRLIARVLKTTGQACRFGGDEFSAFLPNHDIVAARMIAEEIRQAVESAGFEKDDIPLRPTISIGIAGYPDSGEDTQQLVVAADKMLYRAKAQGKNQVAA